VLRVCKIHVPPALAVGLLPLVMNHPGIMYPFSVALGTTSITAWFLIYRRLADNSYAAPLPGGSRPSARL
jgi:hypothetical protein